MVQVFCFETPQGMVRSFFKMINVAKITPIGELNQPVIENQLPTKVTPTKG